MALTREEELELQMLESDERLAQPATAIAVEAKSGLTPEETLELSALELANKQDVSKSESLIRGAAQGATLGFSDEASGLVGAGIRKLRGDQGDFGEIYEQERNIEREKNLLAEEANPLTFGAGSVGGSILSTIGSGGTTAGFRAAAVLGGLSGVGFSNATGTELIKDAAIGTALGLGGEAVFKGVGKAIGKVVGKSSKSSQLVLAEIGETRHPQNVSFETGIYRQALKGGFDDMDGFFSSAEARKSAASWAGVAPEIPKDLLNARRVNANAQLKAIISAPENQGNKVVVTDIVDELIGGESGLAQFRGAGLQKQAVDTIGDKIIKPLQSGQLKLAGRLADPSSLDFDQAIEFKRLVSELTFKNSDPLLDTAEQFAFRKAPAVSQRLEQFAGEIIERTNAADRTGLLRDVNSNLFNIIDAEKLAPRSLKELRELTKDFGDTKAFQRGQEFLFALDKVDETIKKEVANEIVPVMTLVDAIQTADQWNLGVSSLFQAKAGVSAVGPLGALVALGKGGSLLATQAVGKAAKAAFKIPRSIAGIMGNANIVVQKVADLSPVLAIQLNDMIHDRDIEGIRGAMEQALSDPNLSSVFEEGIGFEGKVTNPEEAAQIRDQIMGSSISLSDKVNAVNQLDATQQIPEIPEPLPPQVKPMVLQRKVNERSLDLVRRAEKELGE